MTRYVFRYVLLTNCTGETAAVVPEGWDGNYDPSNYVPKERP